MADDPSDGGFGIYRGGGAVDDVFGRGPGPILTIPPAPAVPKAALGKAALGKAAFPNAALPKAALPNAALPHDARRETTQESPQVIRIDPRILVEYGVFDAVRERLTQPPPIPTDAESKAARACDELAACGPGSEGAGVQSLLRIGPDALPIIAERFPGALWFQRGAAHRRPPSGKSVSPLGAALVAFGADAVPYVAVLLESDSPEVRYYALLVAADLAATHADILVPVGRLLFDHDDQIRETSAYVLRRLAERPEYGRLLGTIESAILNPSTHVMYRLHGVRGLGALREGRAYRALVQLLEDPNEGIREASHTALRQLTAHDFGLDPKPWRKHLSKNATRLRPEWLLDALSNKDRDTRARACEELVLFSGQAIEFDPDAPKRDRKDAEKRWRQWWEDRSSG